MTDPAITAELSQQEDNEEFRSRSLDETQADLGSRECLHSEKNWHIILRKQMSLFVRVGFIIKRKMITIVYSEMRIGIRGLQKRKEPYERLHKMVG